VSFSKPFFHRVFLLLPQCDYRVDP
jgi:hypothetical protein